MDDQNSGDNGLNRQHEPDTFDIRAAVLFAVDAARCEWKTVALTVFLTLVLVTIYVYVWPPVYKVQPAIMVEPDVDTSRDAFYLDWNVFRKQDAQTEIRLMTSVPVLMEVIKRENLAYDDIYHPVLSQLSYFWRESWLGKKYKAIKDYVYDDPDALDAGKEDLARTLDDMKAGIRIQPQGDSLVATVNVKGPSRRVAQIANTLLDVYIEHRGELYRSEAERSFESLTDELVVADAELREIEQRRLAYAADNGVQVDLQKEQTNVEQLVKLEARVALAEEEVATLEASLVEVDAQIAMGSPMHKTSTITELNAVYEEARMRRFEYQAALVSATGRYREDAPEIQEIKRDLAEINALLAQEPETLERGSTEGVSNVYERLIIERNSTRSRLVGARAGLSVMKTNTERLSQRLTRLPVLQTELYNLSREYNLVQQKYEILALRRSQAMVSVTTSTTAMPSLRIIGYARVPSSKSWPRLKYLYPAGLLMGLVLGVLAAVLVHYFGGRIHSAHLENGRGTAPLYATVRVATAAPPIRVVNGPSLSVMNAPPEKR